MGNCQVELELSCMHHAADNAKEREDTLKKAVKSVKDDLQGKTPVEDALERELKRTRAKLAAA